MFDISNVSQELKKLANKQKTQAYARFFKTGKGEYGEGDKFLGLTVPQQRKIARKYQNLPLGQVTKLLQNPYHECRLTALLILTSQFQKSSHYRQKQIVNIYLKNLKYVNNWDLVDISAPKILGAFLLENNLLRFQLKKLAKSTNLWEKRVAILATFTFIKKGNFKETLKIAKMLLLDQHDLIHKAVGWMLREIGKIDLKTEEKFLQKYYPKMPRTMLRYAIEKFPEAKRQAFLKGKV